jgi:hypothetical protein
VRDRMKPYVLNERALNDIVGTAAGGSVFPPAVLEKDLWVVWTLQALYGDPEIGGALGFKGGTSLSKAYGVITRFSEDVDLTVDYRTFGDAVDPLAAPSISRSQLKAFRERIESEHLPTYLHSRVLPRLAAAARETLDHQRRPAIEIDEADGSKVHVRYPSVLERGAYLRESVLLEFGGRLTIEPTEVRPIRTYLVDDLPGLADAYEFPSATPTVVHGARTFWEKVTAVHAFLTRKDAALRFARSERLSRHWYDLHALRGHDLGLAALANPELRDAVIRLKSLHFAAPGVDYDRCRTGAASLVPDGELLAGLRRDYEDMIVQGMFRVDDPPPVFAELIAGIRALEDEVNAL